MSDIEKVLRAEISRLARKEVRGEIENLRKASTQQRSAIAELRRQIDALGRSLKQVSKAAARPPRHAAASDADGASDGTPRRFSATRLASHRAKLGLSAADYGRLVGMSGATIYNWEQGKSRPNAGQLQALAAVRGMGKREVAARLAEA